MRKTKTLFLSLLVAPAFGYAASVPAPALQPGDTWTYVDTVETAPNGWRQSHDEIVVLRTTSDHIYFESKQAGSTQAARELIAGADWSRSRNVNGTETLVNRPLSFPLSSGKNWDVKYTELHPNVQHSSESFDTHFKVVGPETIEVAGGKFETIKVEAEGDWTAEVAPAQVASSMAIHNQAGATVVAQARNVAPVTATGRTYMAFWYAPDVGRWVKSVEEYYGSNGQRNQRFSSELESFKHGAPQQQ